MSNVKKQNTLFRFVSLRSPELSKNKNQKNRFVFPETSSGIFHNAIKSSSELKSRQTALQEAAQSVTAFTGESEIEVLCGEKFYSAAQWISQNRSNIPAELTLEKLKDLNASDTYTENILWDQLFYQITTSSSLYVKEALMHCLILQNLLKYREKCANDNEFATQLSVLAQARIVIPKELFEKEENNQEEEIPGMASAVFQKLEIARQKTEARLQIETYQSVLSIINKKVSDIKEKYQEAYTLAKEEHQKSIQPLLEEYQKNYRVEAQRLNRLALEEGNDPNSLCYQPNIEKPEIPEFTFKPLSNILSLLLEELPEGELKDTLVSLIEKYEIEDPEEVIKFLKKETEKEYKTLTENIKTTVPVAVIGSSVVPLTSEIPTQQNLPFRSNITPGSNGSIFYIHMYITLPETGLSDTGYIFSDISYKISSEADISEGQKYVYNYTEDHSVLHILFYTNNTQNIPQQILGTLSFENGNQYQFDFEAAWGKTFNGNLIKLQTTEEEKEEESEKIPSGFGITQLGIADYKKVVSEVACYEAGEVSHIENIMAREYKERSTKKFNQAQTTTTESSETETEKLSDIISSERFEMQSEIAKIMQEQKNSSVNTNAHYSYGKNFSIDIGAGFATANSKEDSNRQALTEAKELTQQAMERIVTKIKKEVSTQTTEEFTEENKHGFDNRKGDHHVSGVYRFINAIYRNQIYNYGKRLMYEFVIPQPAKFHTLWMNNSQTENINTLEKPIDPRKCGLTNASILNKSNYKEWASKYGAEVEAYPEEELSIGESFSGSASGETSRIEYFSGKDKIEIPEGYKAIKAYVTINAADNGDRNDGKGVLVNIGNIKVSETTKAALVNYSSEVSFKTKFEKFVPFSTTFANYFSGSITISVHCVLSESAESNWQIETFNAIINAYQAQLDEYNSKLSDIKTENKARIETNPLFYRQIEQTVLRKNCISYLCDSKSIGKKMYSGNSLQNYRITASRELDEYGNFIRFMEQAFEWDMMSYSFYPFYWGNKEEWNDLYQFDSDDPLFKNFMQSGLARVIVTVKPGFEDAVMHYMASGQIWNGGEIPVIDDPLYLSIVDELKEQEYVVEETWETIVPTSLIALQNSGVAVDASGLPCFHKDEGTGTLTSNDKKVGESGSENKTEQEPETI